MSKFLNWASDVLEAVDQSAANLSDSKSDKKRNKKRESQEKDGNSSDSNWVKGEEFRNKYGSNDNLDESKWLRDSEYHPSSFSRRHSLRDIADASSDSEDFFNRPSMNSSASASFNELSLFNFSAPKFTQNKPPPVISVSKTNFLSAQKRLKNHGWYQTEIQKEFEETVQKINKEEAEVSVLSTEVEQLRKTSSLSEAMNLQELKNLKEEGLSAQRAYGTEKNDHSTTLIQSKMRISSLNAENAAYAKAIAAIKKYTEEKSMEEARINSQILKTEKEIESLNLEFLEMEKNKDGNIIHGVNNEIVHNVSDNYEANVQEDYEILEQKQMQLSKLESKIEELKCQVEQSRKNMLKHSSNQREQKLEKRLILLSEKLLAKQYQLDNLSNEKNLMLLRLQRIQSTYQNLQNGIGFSDVEMKRNKIIRPYPLKPSKFSSFSQKSNLAVTDDPSGKLRSRHSADSGNVFFHNVDRFMNFMDDVTLRLNVSAQRHVVFRSGVVLYVLCLHLIVIVVLSRASAQSFGRGD